MTDKLKKLIEEELESAYNQGLAEGKRINEKGCEGCEYEEVIGVPCRYCANRYPNQWKAKSNEIRFGDEVVDNGGEKGIVVSKDNAIRDQLWVLFNGYDVPQNVSKRKYKKTGKHYDLDSYMEVLKE